MNARQPVTIVIIAINVLVFALVAWQVQSIMMNTNEAVLTILHAGANLNPFTLGGQPWRIVTSMFLHFGIIHLVVNMYALWSLGTLIETGIGSVRFLLLYLITGLFASIASLIFNVYIISAGASGAIFGLYGYQLGAQLISSYRDMDKLKPVLINFVIFVAVNTFIAGRVNVDMSGHIGGCVAGVIMALCHFKFRVLKQKLHMAVVIVALPFTLFFLPQDQVRYYKLFQRIIRQENLLSALPNNNTAVDSLVKAQNEWKAIRKDLLLIPSLRSEIASDTSTVLQYISLRIRHIDYKLHVYNESYIYMDSIEYLNARFDSVPPLKYIPNFSLPKQTIEEQDTVKQEDSQSSLTMTQVYYDKDWREISDSEAALYYRIGMRDSLNRWQGIVHDFFRNGDLQMKGKYSNDLQHGIFIYYSDHHTYSSAGRYENELPVGKWEHFHWNGKIQSEVFHNPGSYTRSVWDSLGNLQVSEGNGEFKRWHANGNLAEQGNYERGVREGYWYGYHENGKPYYKELYRNNRLINGVSEGKDGRRYVYDGISQLPVPDAGVATYNKYIMNNKREFPGEENKGVVKVLFNVGVDGMVWDFVIFKSVSPACDQEAIRLVREGPAWRPAAMHGAEKVLAKGMAEIEF